MAEKVLNSRIINKHDIAANWELAVNFIPKSGEIIVYEPDNVTPYARLKVGDGTTRVNDLNFLSEEEFAALRNDLTTLSELVGDTSVTDQISEAIENSEKFFVVSATYSSSSSTGFIANVGKTEILNAINNGLFPMFTLQNSGVVYHYWGQDSNGNPIFKAPTMVEENGVIYIRSLTVTIYEDKTVTMSNPLEIEKYTLPTATSTTLGGVKPVAKTAAMTQEIGVDSTGKLYTTPTDLTALNTLVGDDTGKSAREIAEEELIKQLVPETAQESLDTLTEIAAWIQEHPDDAAAMNEDITELQGLVGTTSVQEQINAAIQDNVAQADWSESDPTNPAYVKNRTHYVQYFYETLMQEFYFNVAEKITHELTGQLLYDGTIIRSEIGTTLRLTLFNYNSEESKTYEGKVRFLVETGYVVDFQDENNNIVCSIVQSLHDFGVYESNKTYIYNLDAGTYDILIEGPTETVIKLDKKFLPDDIVYLSDIEELTIEEIDEICGATIVSLQDVQY